MRWTRKFVGMITFFVLCTAAVPTLAAEPHVHDKSSPQILREATCTEDGVIQYTCSVDNEVYEEAIPAKGHEWNTDYTVDKEATYNVPGEKSIHCSVCDEKKQGSQVEIPKLKYVDKISLDETSLKLTEQNKKVQLVVTVSPEDASDTRIQWSSSDPSVAKVDERGRVTALKNGTAVITAQSIDGSNKTASCTVTVELLNGLCLQPGTSDWYYYRDGKIDRTFTGLAKNEHGWWRIEEGEINFDFTGLAQNEYGWWYLQGGKINFNYTGLAANEYGWWRVENGQVNFSYKGLVQNEAGWWYLQGGKINFDYTGLAQNQYGWWRVDKGMVNFNYKGLTQNEYGWWYLQGGKINFNYTGLAQNENGWWRVEKGKINFGFTGLVQNEYGWWYLQGGKINFNYTGLAQNQYGWWRIENGKINFNYVGVAKNQYGWWYLRGGKVDFGYTGKVISDANYWIVVNGKASGYSITYYTVTDTSSIMYGKTLKLYYDLDGNLVQDISNLYNGNRTYELYVNKTKNMVTVYTTENNVYIPVKRFICSQGGSNTPEGTFYTPAKYRWQELMLECWGQWCTRIQGGVLFHSVYYNSYNNNNNLSVSAYNKLGTTCSHGCIRLTAGDAKWIYDNCALKTKVVIYSKNGYEPFSKPTAYKLPSWHKWDPTDPNMYYKCRQKGCH